MDSVVEICFKFFYPNSETTNMLHNMMTDMPSSVNRWSTPNKEDRHPGRASPAAIEKPGVVQDNKMLSRGISVTFDFLGGSITLIQFYENTGFIQFYSYWADFFVAQEIHSFSSLFMVHLRLILLLLSSSSLFLFPCVVEEEDAG